MKNDIKDDKKIQQGNSRNQHLKPSTSTKRNLPSQHVKTTKFAPSNGQLLEPHWLPHQRTNNQQNRIRRPPKAPTMESTTNFTPKHTKDM